MPFEDKTLKCKECGANFTFSAKEQELYQEKGFRNEPVRCPECRRKKRDASREMTEITCSECGKRDTVPFKPIADRPVYCRDCFEKIRAQR